MSEEDKNKIPYNGNEILIFQSDKGRLDTIFIQGFSTNNACYDPLAIFIDYCEEIRLNTTQKDSEYDRYLEGNSLVKILTNQNGEALISFNILLKDARFYGHSSFKLKDFENISETELIINKKRFENVKVIVADKDAKFFKNRSNYINKFYWSLEEGLIGFDKENEKWRLKKKYTNLQLRQKRD